MCEEGITRVLKGRGEGGGTASEARLERSGEPRSWVWGLKKQLFQVRALYNSLRTYVFL